MEDLLIEHPTMSVYHARTSGERLSDDLQSPGTGNTLAGLLEQEQNANTNRNQNTPTNRQLVLLRNRQRHQLAAHLQIPLIMAQNPRATLAAKPPKLTRRALRRQNVNLFRGGKLANRLQKNTFRPGRRRF